MRARQLGSVAAAVAAVTVAVGVPIARSTTAPAPGPAAQTSAAQTSAAPTSAAACAARLADRRPLAFADRRTCVIAVASTYLRGEDGSLAPRDVVLDPQVARHRLGEAPRHEPGGANRLRAAWAAGKRVGGISSPEWTVDGDDAFVAYAVHDDEAKPAARHVAARIRLRRGLVWEVLENPTTGPSSPGARSTRTPFHEAVALAGRTHPPVDMTAPDHDDAAYCSLVLAERGDASLTPAQERRCLVAIAATYVDAEGNEIDDSLTLFDPRFSKYSLGGPTNHHPGNGDTNRMDQIALSPTIRLIRNKQWTADPTTDQVWIVYDGYLPASTDKPGFYVAERFTIRDGLIWEIMISPVVVDVPGSLVPTGPPVL